MHRRRCRRHGRGDRRRASDLRYHRLVDEPRVPPALPHAVARCAAGGEGGHARRADCRGRRDGGNDLHRAAGVAAGRCGPMARGIHLEVPLGADARRRRQMGVPYNRVVVKEPMGVVGGHHPVELSVRDHQQQDGPDPGHRKHDGAQARHRDAVERAALGPDHRREDRHPRRRRQHRPGLGQRRRPDARYRSPRRHGLVHRFDGGRQADPEPCPATR